MSHPTDSDISQAERAAQKQRHAGARFLVICTKGASEADIALAARVKDAGKHGPADFDEALHWPGVNDLFRRRVLFYSKDG